MTIILTVYPNGIQEKITKIIRRGIYMEKKALVTIKINGKSIEFNSDKTTMENLLKDCNEAFLRIEIDSNIRNINLRRLKIDHEQHEIAYFLFMNLISTLRENRSLRIKNHKLREQLKSKENEDIFNSIFNNKKK